MRYLFSFLVVVSFAVSAQATAIKEAPWSPRAAAYRLTLFMGNLAPVPWDQLSDVWEKPAPGSDLDRPALSQLSEDGRAAVQAALQDKDRQQLFVAATRALAQGLLTHLEQAEHQLGTAEAGQELARAKALYRAVADEIRLADAAAARRLGRAWLQMTSALGSSGVMGQAAKPADQKVFRQARAVVDNYIHLNYLPTDFVVRDRLTALPESVVAAGVEIAVPVFFPPGTNIADQTDFPRLILQFEEAGEDESNLPLVAYGDMLFDSPEIFGGPARDLGLTCSTCHNRSDINRDFFIPGLSHRAGGLDVDSSFFNPLFNDRVADHLDTPSMRGVRFTAPYGRDGREPSLRQFIRNVIVTEFAGAEPTAFQLDALVAYIRQFDFLPNPQIERDGSLTALASAAARRGEVIFKTEFKGLGNRSCASCHIPDDHFRDGLIHDIGTTTAPFEGGTPMPLETPTLRNVNFTAPYMHDGSLPTLDSVIAWFNETAEMGLTNQQSADLLAYVEAIGDGEDPYQRFEGKDSVFRLAWEELTTFASTLGTLLPLKDQENIAVLVDTVAPDLAADTVTMVNLSARHEVYAFSDLLRRIGAASAAGQWDEANKHWAAFQAMQGEIDERMY